MAMNRAWLGLFLLVFSMSGCTWFGLVEEKPPSDFGIPEKGALTLIKDVSSRTANVEFSDWYVETLPRPAVRVEGRSVSATGISTLARLMEATRGFRDVKHAWGHPSEYEEVSFGLHGVVSVSMNEGVETKRGWEQEQQLLRNSVGEDFTIERLSPRQWENGWRCNIFVTRYSPREGDRLDLESWLDLVRRVEKDSQLVRSVIARLWIDQGKVSQAIVRWNCYRPPGS